MSEPANINQRAQDYLAAHTNRQHANTQLDAAQRVYNTAHESLEKAEDALQDCVGDSIARRAIHIDGVTVLVEYSKQNDVAHIMVLNEDGEVR